MCPGSDLLTHRERLVIELLDKLAGHLIGVVRAGVCALLLQEVDLYGHRADALLRLIEVVIGH